MKFARIYYAASPTQMYLRFGFPPRGAIAPTVQIIDTHDGVTKKKKKKQRTFDEELERTAKLKKQIHEAVYPVTPQEVEPEIEPKTEPEVRPVTVKTSVTPPVDYAGLAKQEIAAKLAQDAILKARKQYEELQRQLELKRLEDEEEERELMMILDDIL